MGIAFSRKKSKKLVDNIQPVIQADEFYAKWDVAQAIYTAGGNFPQSLKLADDTNIIGMISDKKFFFRFTSSDDAGVSMERDLFVPPDSLVFVRVPQMLNESETQASDIYIQIIGANPNTLVRVVEC